MKTFWKRATVVVRLVPFAMMGLPVHAAKVPVVEIRVSPGDAESLRTIPEKVDAVHSDNPDALAMVRFAAGDYTVPVGGLVFANTRGQFALCSDAGARVRLFGSVLVSRWKRTKFNGRIVWTADASAIPFKSRPDLFFCGGRTMIMARTPDFDPANPYAGGWRYADGDPVNMYKDIPGETRTQLCVKQEDWREFADCTEGRIFTFPRYNWQSSVSPVTNAVAASHTLYVSRPFFFASRPCDRYYLTGFREDLTSPGEWYFDWEARRVYFIPPPDVPNPNAVPCSFALDYPVIRFHNVSDARVRGLELLNAAGGVRISDSCRVRVVGCRIHDVGYHGGSGVSGHAVTDCRVTDCDIWNTGCHGVQLVSPDMPGLSLCSNRVANCYIHHTGWVNKHGVGVSIGGQGATVEHNLIHDTPRTGIFHSGRLHTIRFNRIRHTNLEMEDTGGIYGGGWTSLQGTRIENNWVSDTIGFGRDGREFHHYHTAHGIYLDDGSGDAIVAGNIVERSTTAMHLHCHRYGTITNNLFISNGPDKQFNMQGWHAGAGGNFETVCQPRDLKSYLRVVGANPVLTNFASLAVEPSGTNPYLPDGCVMQGNRVERNVFYCPDMPKSQGARVDKVFNTAHNRFGRNVYWSGKNNAVTIGMGWAKAIPFNEWQKMGEDVNSVVADPLIADPAHGDFTLAPDSPALKLGFVQIPFRKIGLRPSSWRKEFPIAEAEGVREHPEWLHRK